MLKRAKLPAHFTPHCLRHTFASILIADGKSPAYVQDQLGHASIAMTVDTYGKWLPKGDKAAIDSLDDDPCTVGTPESGDRAYAIGTSGHHGGDQVVTLEAKVGAKAAARAVAAPPVPEELRELATNGPCWTRTNDPLLKRRACHAGSRRPITATSQEMDVARSAGDQA